MKIFLDCFFAIGEPITDMFGGLLNALMVDCHVFGSRYYNQILDPIIVLKPVKMMNNFISGQKTSQLFLDSQSMLKDIPLKSGVRMLRHKNINIISSLNLTSPPFRVSNTSTNITFARAIFTSAVFKFRWGNKEFATTCNTAPFDWGVSVFPLLNHQSNPRLSSI